jgi:hypothetical protein
MATDLTVGGTDAAATIGADGFPVIATGGAGAFVVHCLDVTCSSRELHTLSGASTTGKVSIAIASNGFPLVVNDLDLFACHDLGCSTNFRRQLDSGLPSRLGVRPTSIAIGTDGFPLISYVMDSGATIGQVWVAHCASADCLSLPITKTQLTDGALDGAHVDTSVIIGRDGLGFVAMGGNALSQVHCSNLDCTASTVVIPCRCATSTLKADSIAMSIGPNGEPWIAYRSEGPNQGARLLGATTSGLETGTGAGMGQYSWVTMEPNGHALVIYRDETNSLLRAAYCVDVACATVNLTTIDATTTEFATVVIGVDGLPLVVAGSSTGRRSLIAFHCANIFCVPYARNR